MLLIQNGFLHTMDEKGDFPGDILLKDGKIEKIAEKIKRTESMRLLDAAGRQIYPGFTTPTAISGYPRKSAPPSWTAATRVRTLSLPAFVPWMGSILWTAPFIAPLRRGSRE